MENIMDKRQPIPCGYCKEVMCQEKCEEKCAVCGWNPVVSEARKQNGCKVVK